MTKMPLFWKIGRISSLKNQTIGPKSPEYVSILFQFIHNVIKKIFFPHTFHSFSLQPNEQELSYTLKENSEESSIIIQFFFSDEIKLFKFNVQAL